MKKSVQCKVFTKAELIELYKELVKKANLWCEDEAMERWVIGSLIDAAIGLMFFEIAGHKSLDYFFATK